ncbi:hypothetical protein M8J75_009990 [Diaphorina citri]|nr:hypothetical protein M8J75_009990 [Diaphorina citri]
MSAAVPGSEPGASDPGAQVRLRVASLNSVHTATSAGGGGGGGKRGILGGRGVNNKPYCCFCWCCCCSCTCCIYKTGGHKTSLLSLKNLTIILPLQSQL